MNMRHILDRAVLKISGEDIRLAGNWQPLECAQRMSAELAGELGVAESRLRRCNDITEIIELMEREAEGHSADQDDGQTSLFA